MNKPVAWTDGQFYVSFDRTDICEIPLYTHPVELTDEEIWQTILEIQEEYGTTIYGKGVINQFAKAILRKAQEK